MCHRPDISTIYRSKTDILAIYRSSPISCRTSPISDISEIYRRIYRIFSSLVGSSVAFEVGNQRMKFSKDKKHRDDLLSIAFLSLFALASSKEA